MNKFFFALFTLLILTGNLFGQTQKDSLQSGEELDRVFTREEVPPAYKGGVEEFNNFLAKEINSTTLKGTEDATYRFIVSKKGNIFEITKIKGSLGFEDELIKALQKSSGQWNCGVQNNRQINAYCIINVSLRHKKIHAVIVEQ